MQPDNPLRRPRSIGYRRVSDRSQVANHSLPYQAELLSSTAAFKGWDIEIREEAGGWASGKNTTGRPVLMKTMDELDAGVYDALIVTRLDRLSRNTFDGLKILKRAVENGWDVVILDLNVDTSTPVGKAMVTVLWAFATYEREMILERTSMGRERARVAGKHLGKRTAIPDDVLLEIWTARSADPPVPLKTVAGTLNDRGILSPAGRPWNTGTVSRAARSVTAQRLARAG
jgi:DNA invertase Pin-like site-specific DNA recombinase